MWISSKEKKMGHLNLRIPDELEEKLRELAVKKFGARKGFLTKSIVEALEEWVRKNSQAKELR
jgi:predicted DNA-binding protein